MLLNDSGVIFNQDAHTYHLNGVPLKGITGVLSRHLFSNKYDNIPDYILKRAAERGRFIHENCEIVDSLGVIPDCEEAKNYIKLKEENNLIPAANEYIVTDGKYYASSIDVVFQESDTVASLADIKTTSTFDKEYVSWQLSIYSYLFERQNPHLKAGRLYGIWLRESIHELIEVERKPYEVIIDLLRCDVTGGVFNNPYSVSKSDVPAQVYEVEQYMCELDAEIKELTEKKDKILSGLLDLMNEYGVDNWKGHKIQLIRKKPSTRESLDSKLLKEQYPGIYKEFLKISQVKGSIIFKKL